MRVRKKDRKRNTKYIPKRKSAALSFVTVVKGLAVGILAGTAVTAYRYMLELVTKLTFPVYEEMSGNTIGIIAVFLALALCGYLVGFMIKKEPLIVGSGIPQVKGYLVGKMKFPWLRVLLLKFVGGIVALGAGLSLGREGPSVQIGAAAGLGMASVTGGNSSKQRLLMSYGAAAGLAAAFNAPLAGVCFAIEELHKSISKYVLLGAALSAFSADVIAKLVFGAKPIFSVAMRADMPLKDYLFIVALGIAIGVLGAAFNKLLIYSSDGYGKLVSKLPVEFKPVIPFLFAGIIGFCFPLLLGGGNGLINKLFEQNYALSFLFAVFFIKFAFTLVSYSGSAPGGIFFPVLSIGAVAGCIIGKLFTVFFGLDAGYIPTFIILAMAGYFSATVKSPLTGIVLISEMTGGFESFLMLLAVCVVSSITAYLLKTEPVYDSLLKYKIMKDGNMEEGAEKDAVIDVTVKVGTYTVGSMFRNIDFPEYIQIVSIKRCGENIKITDNLRIAVGDVVSVKTSEWHMQDAVGFFDKPKRR